MDDIVWARDHTEGYILGRIVELMDDEAEVLPIDSKFPRRVLPYSDIFRAQPEKDRIYDDNCKTKETYNNFSSILAILNYR